MYSFNKILTMDGCDVLITWAERKKSDLIIKSLPLKNKTINYSSALEEIDAVIEGILKNLDATKEVINILPEGVIKEAEIKKTNRLNDKKIALEYRRECHFIETLLKIELNLKQINNETDELDAFIAGVIAHKSTLQDNCSTL